MSDRRLHLHPGPGAVAFKMVVLRSPRKAYILPVQRIAAAVRYLPYGFASAARSGAPAGAIRVGALHFKDRGHSGLTVLRCYGVTGKRWGEGSG
jgi:hypothetical protein